MKRSFFVRPNEKCGLVEIADGFPGSSLATTLEEFCRNISAALDNPSFETKQKILRLVVDLIEFRDDQITIKHVIPISDVRLQRNQHNDCTPSMQLCQRRP
ncbi:MAG: hypothetical protein L0226_09810 [Acidobacteria bacterium]|nr:hypothetical protein [Acidobacteriota bacterium]